MLLRRSGFDVLMCSTQDYTKNKVPSRQGAKAAAGDTGADAGVGAAAAGGGTGAGPSIDDAGAEGVLDGSQLEQGLIEDREAERALSDDANDVDGGGGVEDASIGEDTEQGEGGVGADSGGGVGQQGGAGVGADAGGEEGKDAEPKKDKYEQLKVRGMHGTSHIARNPL